MAENTKQTILPIDTDELDTPDSLVVADYTPDYQNLRFHDLIQEGVATAAEVTGLPTLVDKEDLIDVPFVIVGYQRHETDLGRGYYYTVHVVTEKNEILAFNDGGAGILPAIDKWIAMDHRGGSILCPRGLRVSRYNYNGTQAETYYLA